MNIKSRFWRIFWAGQLKMIGVYTGTWLALDFANFLGWGDMGMTLVHPVFCVIYCILVQGRIQTEGVGWDRKKKVVMNTLSLTVPAFAPLVWVYFLGWVGFFVTHMILSIPFVLWADEG